jgi:hypothetical protein
VAFKKVISGFKNQVSKWIHNKLQRAFYKQIGLKQIIVVNGTIVLALSKIGLSKELIVLILLFI